MVGMIERDQPRCFPDRLIVAVSSRTDGTMLDRTLGDRHDPRVVANRRAFLTRVGLDYDMSVYQIISYREGRTYDDIVEISEPNLIGVEADALYTEVRDVSLFLPVADCVATVIYDTVGGRLILAHLGRHASVAKLMTKAVQYMVAKGSDVSNLTIWMAPSVGRASYRMEYFGYTDDPDWRGYYDTMSDGIYLDLPGFNRGLAIAAGVTEVSIHVPVVDTATNPDYFSHSQGDIAGRFAVVASLRS